MKRNLFVLALALVMVLTLALTGCQKACEHEWVSANCSDPKTCKLCDATEGAPLGHTWKAATCNAAKTCEICGKTEGDALGHNWVDASCEDPKTCSNCKAEEGEALGHSWVDATTEAPKTCTTCKKTEGDPIDVDDRFVTANCQELFGSWSGEYIQSFESMGLDSNIKLTFLVTMTFRNDGVMTIEMEPNPDTYAAEMKVYMTEVMYATFEAEGMSKAEADAGILATYGMTMEEYIDSLVAEMDPDDAAVNDEQVYYAKDGAIFAADDWDDEMSPETYSIEGNTLTISNTELDMTLVLTKVTE